MNRSQAKEQVLQIAEWFAPYIGKPLFLSFGKHGFNNIVINSIELARTSKMKNAPDKRQDENGEWYTPPVMQMNTSDGTLFFVLEDINIAAITNGLRITASEVQIDFTG